MRPGWRSVAGLLCVTLFLSATGCSTSSVEVAEEESKYLYPGMSMKEVADRLGEPTQIIKGDPGTETVWVYRFEGGTSAASTIVMVVFFVAIVAVVAAAAIGSKGGGGSFNIGGGGGGSDGPPMQIRITFDGDGRLRDVTPPHPVQSP